MKLAKLKLFSRSIQQAQCKLYKCNTTLNLQIYLRYPCLTQVRRKIKECVERLFNEIGPDNLRIGITAHGDYIDKPTSYVTKHLPMTSNVT
jgi:hypothetical protein